MGLFDLFSGKKKERERQEQLRLQQEAEAKRRAEEKRRQEDAIRRAEEKRQQEEARKRELEQKRLSQINEAYLAVFSASWCGPSKRFLKEIQAAGINNYTLIDVDEDSALATKYSIRSVPTTLLLDNDGNIIKKWLGYDDDDPGQTKFVNFIKNCSFTVRPFSESSLAKSHQAVLSTLEEIIGTEEKPAKVEKKKLADGSIYTGEAILCKNGFYLPNGWGKKYVSKDLELTGSWRDGNMNGVCYMNLHHSMVTGHFVDSRPDGWCLSIEGGRGFVFGVFKIDDCVNSLGEAVTWMIRSVDLGLKTFSVKKQILVGQVQIANNKAMGFHFMNNGDVYVGIDNIMLDKTGYFFKFSHDGYIQIGRFEKGNLIERMDAKDVVKANGVSPSLLTVNVDTNKNYF